VDERDAYANLVLPGLIGRARLDTRDAALATELAYGALRGRGTYDAVLAACVDRPLGEVDPGVLDALRLGVHQLLATRVPQHAAVSSTVDLVRATSGPGASRFANAVLRRVADRDAEAWPSVVGPDAATDPDGHLAVLQSYPEWIIRAFRDALRADGRDPAGLPVLLAAQNVRPQVSLATLPGLADPADLPGARPGVLSPIAVRAVGAPDRLAAVREGRARVQDEGSQLVTLALAAAPLVGPDRGRWLDLCAGPGGKAALLGALLAASRVSVGDRPGSGDLPDAEGTADPPLLVAVEAQEHRAAMVAGALAPPAGLRDETGRPRLRTEVRVGDGRELLGEEAGRYDRVLVDVPCTGLGALRRRPEARWRRTPSDLVALGPLQRGLLDAALAAVRPGGVVAYVTCSPHPAETRAVVGDVLRRRSDVTRLDARPVLLEVTGGRITDLGPGPAVQLWPDLHGTDGMFLALLRREP
jgi:16S rRNA (cytosine967-C5)-methyltransferase